MGSSCGNGLTVCPVWEMDGLHPVTHWGLPMEHLLLRPLFWSSVLEGFLCRLTES